MAERHAEAAEHRAEAEAMTEHGAKEMKEDPDREEPTPGTGAERHRPPANIPLSRRDAEMSTVIWNHASAGQPGNECDSTGLPRDGWSRPGSARCPSGTGNGQIVAMT